MTNLAGTPQFFARRLSEYVPGMQYAADVNISGAVRVNFGAPANASPVTFLSGQSVSTAGTASSAAVIGAAFGRVLSYTLAGAGSGVVTIIGLDYLGQMIQESVTLVGSGTATGLKAFKSLLSITWPVVGATTLSVGFTNIFGLPYKLLRFVTEESGGVPVATLGTVVNPDLTSPATNLTGDPRGLYTPTTTPNGSSIISATYLASSDVDVNNVGGLHGVPQFGG